VKEPIKTNDFTRTKLGVKPVRVRKFETDVGAIIFILPSTTTPKI